MRVTNNQADEELLQVHVTESLNTVQWLAGKGHDWVPASLTNDNVLTMNGGGAGLQKRNFDILERAGAAFHYETAATELLEDRTGRVTGVRARYLGPGWDSVHVHGDSLNRYRYPYGILVNMKSERFIDEVYDTRGRTYASMGRAIMAQHDRLGARSAAGGARLYLRHTRRYIA